MPGRGEGGGRQEQKKRKKKNASLFVIAFVSYWTILKTMLVCIQRRLNK